MYQDPHNTGTSNKPPILVRTEYNIWQRRMSHVLAQQDTGCWKSVVFGPHVPMVPSTEDPKVQVPKSVDNYSEQDFKKIELDAKAFSIVAMALPNDIYAGLLHCNSAKELWDALKEQFGGTEEVIENNREILNQQYETFSHVKGESLTQQFERFNCLISELRLVGLTYERTTLNHRFLRSLPDKWDTIAIVMRNSVGFKDLSLTQLHGKLLTYERELNQKKKLQDSGRVSDDYVLGNTALLGQEEGSGGSKDQSYDHHIDITSGFNSGFNSDSYSPNYAFAASGDIQVSDNMSFEFNDLQHFDPDDLEEMDILHQLALLSVRTNNFFKRTGRRYPGLHGKSKVGLDKSKIKCYKCHRMGHFARECRSQNGAPMITYQNQRPHTNTYQYVQNTPGPNVQNTAHFAQSTSVPVHYVQTSVPQYHYVQTPVNQVQVPIAATPPSAPAETSQQSQQSFFTQGFVDWSSLPDDVTDENIALVANAQNESNTFCFMAQELNDEEFVTKEDVTESVINDVVGEGNTTEESEAVVVNLSDPWGTDDCESQCNCALMAAAKVSPQILSELCSDKCIIAFAKIKEVNENFRQKILEDEINFEKLTKELKLKLSEKESEISSLKHEASIVKDQLQTMITKYQGCKKELESTQVECQRWVESSKGFEMILNQQSKSHVKFGFGYTETTDQPSQSTDKKTQQLAEVIPTNLSGQEIKITEPNGKKITFEKSDGSSSLAELDKYQIKPKWSDECDVLENFKPVEFRTSSGKMAPQAKIIPLRDLPADAQTSAKKKKEKGKDANLFCDFCEKKNHVAKTCLLLKAYEVSKRTNLGDSKTCSICGKKNHKTMDCLYLKNFDSKIQEHKAKTKESQGVSTSKGKLKQTFTSVQTPVTKQLNENFVPREIQVTDAPPSNKFPRGHGQPPCHRLSHVYEEPKRTFKPKVNRHPHGYQHLIGSGQTSVAPSVDIQTLAKGQQQLLDLVQKLVQTTDHLPKIETGKSVDPTKANLALDSHLN